MANTEVLKTLQLVRDAKSAVREALSSATPETAPPLQDLDNCLEEVEGTLICVALDEKIEALRKSRQQLDGICKEINAKMKSLKEVTDRVAVAAKAIGILVDIVAKAAKLAALV